MLPHNPADASELSHWANPNARSADPVTDVTASIQSLTPSAVNKNGNTTVSLKITNHASVPLNQLALTLHAGSKADSSNSIRLAQLQNANELASTPSSISLPQTVDPGESATVDVKLAVGSSTVSSTDRTLTAPNIAEAGAYPLAMSLQGVLEEGNGVQNLDVVRTTLSVTDEQPHGDPPAPLTFLWPLAADAHVTPGNTGDAPKRAPLYLQDDHLADELSPGGRLHSLLDAYKDGIRGEQGDELRQASCVAIDPELLDVVHRMSTGYMVGPTVPPTTEEPRRLRDSWGKIFDDAKTKIANRLGIQRANEYSARPGVGAQAAKEWLDELKGLVQGGCSVALPYSGADLNAIGASGDDWLAVHALGRGPEIFQDVLGTRPTENVVVPPSGLIAPGNVRLLAAGETKDIDASMSTRYEVMKKGAPALPPQSSVTALLADNTVNTLRDADPVAATGAGDGENDSAHSAERDDAWNRRLVRLQSQPPQPPHNDFTALTYSGALGTVLQATGSQPEVAAYSNPDSRLPLDADSQAARMGTAVAVLNQEISTGEPVLAVPPALWSVDATGAHSFISAVTSALSQHRAEPTSLANAMAPRGIHPDQLPLGNTTVPFTDPGAADLATAQRMGFLAKYIDELTQIMRDDQNIALSREAFTRPLFADVVRASSSYRMRERSSWSDVRQAVRSRLERVDQTVGALRRSVSLLPPGSVMTRTSESSPLLVVARNGLPLPVPATIGYSEEKNGGVTLKVPKEQAIPARGSITLPVETDAESSTSKSGLSLWLATPNDVKISEAVKVQVQSVPGMSRTKLLVLTALLFVFALVGKALWDRRTRRN